MEMEEKTLKKTPTSSSSRERSLNKIPCIFLRVCQLELLDRRTAGLTYYATGTKRKRKKEASQSSWRIKTLISQHTMFKIYQIWSRLSNMKSFSNHETIYYEHGDCKRQKETNERRVHLSHRLWQRLTMTDRQDRRTDVLRNRRKPVARIYEQ